MIKPEARKKSEVRSPKSEIGFRAAPSWTWRLAVWGLLALGLTVAAIQYSLRHGRLSSAPDWDDALYLRYGLERLNELHAQGLTACLEGFLRHTPHSPYSAVVAFGSFGLFGVREWAPYLACSGIVLAFLALSDWLLAEAKLHLKLLVAAYLCSIPILVLSVTDFRPDVSWGLALSAAAFTALARPLVGAPAKRLALMGLWGALALLAKPTTWPGTLALLGLLMLLAPLKDWGVSQRRPALRRVLRSWGWVSATVLALAGPYFYEHGAYYGYYVWSVMFGEHRATFRLSGDWLTHVRFFLDGQGGARNLAGHLYLLPVIWLIGWTAALQRRDRSALLEGLAVLGFTAACYALATLNPLKPTTLASPFFCMALGLTVCWLGYLARVEGGRLKAVTAEGGAATSAREGSVLRAACCVAENQAGFTHHAPPITQYALRTTFGPAPLTTTGLVILVILGPFLFRWPSRYYPAGSAERAQSRRLHQEVLDALRRNSRPYPQHVTVTGMGPVRDVTLGWYAACAAAPFTFERPLSANLEDYAACFDRSDFVLGQADQVLGCPEGYPNNRVQGQVLAALRRRDDYQPIAEFAAADGKRLFLFQRTDWRRGVMSGVRAVEGFGPFLGPYPEANPPLPLFCWGTAPVSRLLLTPARAGPANLRIEYRAADGVEAIQVVPLHQDDRRLNEFEKHIPAARPVGRAWALEEFQAPVWAVPGQEIELRYVTGRHGPGRHQNALLITRMELSAAQTQTTP